MSKILVIDDSKMMSLFIHRCLEKAGFEVEEWLPLSALEIPGHLRSSRPDLIVSDYFMPGLSGSSVARSAFETVPRIPVIILTALREEERIASFFRLGVREVLNKPIKPEALVQSVRDALANPQSDP